MRCSILAVGTDFRRAFPCVAVDHHRRLRTGRRLRQRFASRPRRTITSEFHGHACGPAVGTNATTDSNTLTNHTVADPSIGTGSEQREADG
jgi:hypothetical protein